MKDKTKTKHTHSNDSHEKSNPSNHEDFKLGQGYGSGEAESEYQEHPSQKQYGDNPLPKSGGGYAKSGEVQPREDAKTPEQDASR